MSVASDPGAIGVSAEHSSSRNERTSMEVTGHEALMMAVQMTIADAELAASHAAEMADETLPLTLAAEIAAVASVAALVAG